MDLTWRHCDQWKLKGEHFLIEVVRNTVEYHDPDDHIEGPNRWNVYAYIYPKHPHFSKFVGDSIFQDATRVLELHCGSSFCHGHAVPGKDVHCWQVGSDYHHLHDDHFTRISTKEDAYEVFYDAELLFTQLNNMIEKEDAH